MRIILRSSLLLGPIGVLIGLAISLMLGASQPGSFIVAGFTGFVTCALLGGIIQAVPFLTRSRPALLLDETILREDLAVHGDPFKDAGGWLYLTNKHLRFKSHGLSSRKRELCLPLDEIVAFVNDADGRVHSTNKTMRVKMANGVTERFNVEAAQSWQKQIQEPSRVIDLFT